MQQMNFLGDRLQNCALYAIGSLSVCLSLCLSTLVYCGQTVGWIRMPLGMKVGLGPGDTVRWEPRSPKQGAQQPPIFGPCLLLTNSWMDQDAIWYRGRPRPRWHCVRWGPRSPPRKKGTAAPRFDPCLLWRTVAHLSNCWALVVIVRALLWPCFLCVAWCAEVVRMWSASSFSLYSFSSSLASAFGVNIALWH